jgi:hypothetical protein
LREARNRAVPLDAIWEEKDLKAELTAGRHSCPAAPTASAGC